VGALLKLHGNILLADQAQPFDQDVNDTAEDVQSNLCEMVILKNMLFKRSVENFALSMLM
jgi:hypothetical protein